MRSDPVVALYVLVMVALATAMLIAGMWAW